jgi:hypothetical protein
LERRRGKDGRGEHGRARAGSVVDRSERGRGGEFYFFGKVRTRGSEDAIASGGNAWNHYRFPFHCIFLKVIDQSSGETFFKHLNLLRPKRLFVLQRQKIHTAPQVQAFFSVEPGYDCFPPVVAE